MGKRFMTNMTDRKLGFIVLFLLVAVLHTNRLTMTRECIFCNIISKKQNTDLLFENDNFVIIKDIRPACDFHYLAIPKRHIKDGRDLQITDKPLLLEMEQELRNLFAKENISSEHILLGFHWPPFISVQHLHMHGLAPTTQMNLTSRWIFRPLNYWFRTPQYVADNIMPKETDETPSETK